jgi:hypothetical protein
MALRLFYDIIRKFESDDYFQESFGYTCVDQGDVPGRLGLDIEAVVRRKLRKDNLWPIRTKYEAYTEPDFFDMVEFLHDAVSKPLDGSYHSYASCGWHYSVFDRGAGRAEYRAEINEILSDYSDGFELSEHGEIQALAPVGLADLLETPLPESSPAEVGIKVEVAVARFRHHRASTEDKKVAVRDLGDALELLRPQMKQCFVNKDEADFFNILNNFGVRHHNDQQLTGYDADIFLPWFFYHELAAIHACLHMIGRSGA